MSVTINWAQCHTRPLLMIPGPTELPPPVIQALNQPPTIQYDRSFDEGVLEPTTPALREASIFLLDTVSSIAGIDVRTDEWGVDLNMTGSQKCLAAPLGLALVAVSPRAWQVMERRQRPASSWAYDLLRWKELWIPESRGGRVKDGAPRRQPVSMPTHLTAAMQVAVRLILEERLR